MINDQNKFIFIHIPKTGGMSIFRFLKEKQLTNNQYFTKHIENRINQNTFKNFQDYFTFAFHRNPWDRMVSLWKYWTVKRNPYATVSDQILEKCPKAKDFDGFCYNFKNIFCNILSKEKHYIYTLNQSDLNGQKDFIKINFWGRFQYLNEDFSHICSTLKLNYSKLPHINQTYHQKYKDYYNDSLKKLVGKIFEKDIDIFKYTFYN